MNGLSSGAHGRVNDSGDVQVTVTCGRWADRDRDVRQSDVERISVGVAVYRNRPDAHRLQRANHPDGDLAPVGYQNRIETHHAHIRKTPYDTGSTGAVDITESARPTTVLVSAGSMTPSSQSRAVE